jgi:hypothetical protein
VAWIRRCISSNERNGNQVILSWCRSIFPTHHGFASTGMVWPSTPCPKKGWFSCRNAEDLDADNAVVTPDENVSPASRIHPVSLWFLFFISFLWIPFLLFSEKKMFSAGRVFASRVGSRAMIQSQAVSALRQPQTLRYFAASVSSFMAGFDESLFPPPKSTPVI